MLLVNLFHVSFSLSLVVLSKSHYTGTLYYDVNLYLSFPLHVEP